MKILNLVLYSDTQNVYIEMKNILDTFYKTYHPNVETIFYKYSSDIENISLVDNILHIKGNESFVPGILQKTLKVFEYVVQSDSYNKYDYIVRSNISTVIDFDLFVKELEKNPVKMYAGGLIHNLQWANPHCGIHDRTHFGTLFANGTSITFSKEGLKYLIENQHLIDQSIIDDVAIGIFIKEHVPESYPPNVIGNNAFKTMNTTYLKNDEVKELNNILSIENNIFYRNRWGTRDRRIDIYHMKLITQFIQGRKYIR